MRVHCDYDEVSAPRRFRQLCQTESYTGVKLSEEEVEKYINGRYSFINVWRNIIDTPVQVKPLAVCDTNSVDAEDRLTYNMLYPERHGSNYALPAGAAHKHKWYHYPFMEKDECLMFYVFNQELEGPRFTFHTAFEDPHTAPDAPSRESIEIRTIACFDDPPQKPIFFDMIHSLSLIHI